MFPKFRIGDIAYIKKEAEKGQLEKYLIGYIRIEIGRDEQKIGYCRGDSSMDCYINSGTLEERFLLTKEEALALATEFHEKELRELKEKGDEK